MELPSGTGTRSLWIVSDEPGFPAVGEILAGRYQVEKVIARGGMGIVVAAKHIQLGQRVAIKVLFHQSGNAEQSVARFLTEAKASALLKSEHVVKVSDVGTLDNGAPFMVMELLEGADLATVLEQEGKLPVEIAVDFVLQAIEGLAAAHVANIVHRDLKPGNIFRSSRGDGTTIIKVLDFGVSKATSSDVRTVGTVTTTDAVFGSPLYMSPEQMQSATRVDARSDIWSLGVVLFELLTARFPFEAESMAGLAVAIATEEPASLSTYLSNPPAGLDRVIEKCLAKRRDERYCNVAEFAADLESFTVDARARVERIQRLIIGKTSAPRSLLPLPISSRKIPMGAETLGPVDAGESAFAAPAPKRSRAPLAIGLALAVTAVVGFVVVRQQRVPALVVHASALDPATLPAPSPVVVAPAASVSQTKPPVDAPVSFASASASVAHPAQRPTLRPKTTHSAVAPTSPPSASVISGIARDRK